MEGISKNHMKTNELGILERILMRRYGHPDETYEAGMLRKIWKAGTPSFSDLYYSADWTKPPASDFRVHQPIYGTSCGGTLVGDSVKVSMPSFKKVFGVGHLHTFVERPEVQRALELDPELAFFMDASGVQYYGHKEGRLFEYDAAFDELNDLGPIESAIEEIVERWEAACPTEEELAEITRRAELAHARDK